MQIDKNSWHYKFRKSLYEHSFMSQFPAYFYKRTDLDTQNGCKYLRDIFLWPWLLPILAIIISTMISFFALSPVVTLLVALFGNFGAFYGTDVGLTMTVISSAIGFVSFILGTTFIFSKTAGVVKKSELVNGLSQFVSEKTCPVVTYKQSTQP